MKRVFIDMDNVLVDFQSGLDQVSDEVKAEYAGRLDEIPGLFAKMKPMPGAIEAVHELQKHYDLYILSTAPWKNPSAWSDKVAWVTKYLDDVFHKKMVITHRKDLCQGDYLIDDQGKNGTSEFAGEWIQFGSGQFPDWDSVLNYLLMDAKIESLIQSLERNYHRWDEPFKDEDTGEEVMVERVEIISTDITEEERKLMEDVAANAAQINTRSLHAFIDSLSHFWPRNYDEVYVELVRRGEEQMACHIEDTAILQELCDKGNKYAAWELYWKHYYGDDEHGIFINRKRAREYYDLALHYGYELDEDGWGAWDDSDDPGEEDPSTYEYVLTGNASTLNGVETLINDLCQRFGTPGNECGLYVPQRMLMKVLVGSDTEYYRGNVMTMEREAPDRLVITTEADMGEPLLYALRQCFDNLTVEMKEYEL